MSAPNQTANATPERWPIPQSWKWVRAKDIADIVGGGTPRNSVDETNYDAEGVPWLTPSDLTGYTASYVECGRRSLSAKGFANSAARLIHAGSVLLSSRAPVGYCVIARNAICTNQWFKNFVLRDQILPEFVRYYLLSSRDYIRARASGTTFLELSGSAAGQLELPIAPAAEQQRIVDKIDELFSLIEAGEQALERARQLLERYRQSVLNAAVTGALTKDWREQHKGEIESGEALLKRILKARREAWEKAELAKLQARGRLPTNDRWKQKYKEPKPPDTTNLFELPEGWVWTTLPMLGEFGRGKSKHRPRNDPKLYGGKYPFIQTGDVRHSIGGIKDHTQTYNNTGLSQSKLWPIGTICITIAANIAETGILQFEACFPDSIVGLVPSDAICGQYIDIFLNRARQDIERYAPATAQKNINLEILADVAIPTPSLGEQDYISDLAGALLSDINHLEQAFKDSAARSSNLRQSILAAAFAGKLVPQEPADEPAAVLLERIRAGRAVATGGGGPPSAARRRGRPRRTSEPELPLAEPEPSAALGQVDPGDFNRGAR